MENLQNIKSVKGFIIEFLLVFLGVFLAFWINDWGEQRRNEEYAKHLLQNLAHDVKTDSTHIIDAIYNIKKQHDSLALLIMHVGVRDFSSASKHLFSSYSTYNVFDPTTETFQSMIFGGDMKLVKNLEMIRSIKDLDHINTKLSEVHDKYYFTVESFRNNFICHYDLDNFDFESIPNKFEFWNRINFLKANIKSYHDVLLMAQAEYTDFLNETRGIIN